MKRIILGERDPENLAGLVHGRPPNKHGKGTVKATLMGTFSSTDLIIFRQTRGLIDHIQSQIEEC